MVPHPPVCFANFIGSDDQQAAMLVKKRSRGSHLKSITKSNSHQIKGYETDFRTKTLESDTG
jgi:hypothetical protein